MVGPLVTVSMGAMNTLLPKLSGLIEGEYKQLSNVKGGISFLRDELSIMNALLLKLSDNEERLDGLAKEWRNKVCDLSYDIEDCIDLFLHKLNHDDVNESIVQKTRRRIETLWSRHKIANIIEGLKARIREESDRRWRYKVDEYVERMSTTVPIDPRLPALYVEADMLVGIDGPTESIIEWMKEDDSSKKLKVVSIVGFGGLGKTTLAKQVFNKMKCQFDCTAFVPVSRTPNIKKILADMLKVLGSSADTANDELQLIDKLIAHLQEKRYLIVVDDIWSTTAWESIKCALPENYLCSRIVTTTRKTDVGQSTCASLEGYVYNIQPLSDKDSQKLFYRRVFRSEPCPPHLVEVSQTIINKCYGLPLAIITIASLIANRNSDAREMWEQVRDSMVPALNAQNVGAILLLSYYDLPCDLKTCFLYLSIFPEDYMIEREELIWMWIAEGFIPKMKGQSLEQIGESYFNDLINRSLVQPIDVAYDGRAEACRVHDMVLDLITSLSTEMNFVTIVEGEVYKCPTNKIRRLSLLSDCVDNNEMQKIMNKCLPVRSLVSFNGIDKQAPHFSKLCYLRALLLEDAYGYLGDQHIKNIGKFIHLKYLRIKSYGITKIPDRIGELQNLQTLDIRGSTEIKRLPPTIGRLQNLVRLLNGPSLTAHLPGAIGNLQALQVLTFVGSYDSVDFAAQLRRLTSLRVLGIQLHGRKKLYDRDSMGRYKEALETSLTRLVKCSLTTLEIDFASYPEAQKLVNILCRDAPCLQKIVCWGFISKIPQGISYLANLLHLAIDVIKIRQTSLYILGGIPTLLFILLRSREAPSERLTIGSHQFCFLKEFEFWSWGDGGLRLVCEPEAMPKLRRLCLEFNAKEAKLDMGFEFSFEHLASLEQVSAKIDCYGATRSRVEDAEAAVRNAAIMHSGHPTLRIMRICEQNI